MHRTFAYLLSYNGLPHRELYEDSSKFRVQTNSEVLSSLNIAQQKALVSALALAILKHELLEYDSKTCLNFSFFIFGS